MPLIRGAPRFLLVLCAGVFATATPLHAGAEEPPGASSEASPAPSTRFRDPVDRRFDVSDFLDTAYGFVPLLVPITEPAIGYGALGALVFVGGEPPGAGQEYVRPNLATVGALRTENGTRGYFGGHLGTWHDGRIKTLAALADVDVNLEFFGLGDRLPGEGLGYSVKAQGGTAGASYRLGETQLWLGLRYASVATSVALETPVSELPGVSSADYDLRIAGLTPSLTLDRRDNFLTPTRGWYVDLSLPIFDDSLGGERDFEKVNATAMYYRPLGPSLYFAVRGAAKHSSDGTPFFLRPFVMLRGVQALRYQGEQAVEFETELRWQLRPRFSVVGFAGAGTAYNSIANRDLDESVAAGGVGFRYLVARRYGLHMGLDIAGGADSTVLYVVFGSAWLRP